MTSMQFYYVFYFAPLFVLNLLTQLSIRIPVCSKTFGITTTKHVAIMRLVSITPIFNFGATFMYFVAAIIWLIYKMLGLNQNQPLHGEVK